VNSHVNNLPAGLSVSKLVAKSSFSAGVSFNVDPTICFTCPEWRSMQGLNFIVARRCMLNVLA
jgi:hypothetical protein